jgi:hypothetical protein
MTSQIQWTCLCLHVIDLELCMEMKSRTCQCYGFVAKNMTGENAH